LLIAVVATLAGCGGSVTPTGVSDSRPLPPDYLPLQVGSGRAYRPAATGDRARAGQPIGALRCRPQRGRRYGAHLEIFVHRHVVAIPLGIGIAPPRLISESRVRSGRCYYPVITTDASGVLEVRAGAAPTLGELFDVWGQPLTRRRFAGFRAARGRSVVAYVGTRRWPGDPRAIPLTRHARVVLELDSRIPPHRVYVFPPGL
jgi:hypothetical protein